MERMTFCNHKLHASFNDGLQTCERPPLEALEPVAAFTCSQLHALPAYATRCKYSALCAPCLQRFSLKQGQKLPTLMHEASNFIINTPTDHTQSNNKKDHHTTHNHIPNHYSTSILLTERWLLASDHCLFQAWN